jgi:hypothetical protein
VLTGTVLDIIDFQVQVALTSSMVSNSLAATLAIGVLLIVRQSYKPQAELTSLDNDPMSQQADSNQSLNHARKESRMRLAIIVSAGTIDYPYNSLPLPCPNPSMNNQIPLRTRQMYHQQRQNSDRSIEKGASSCVFFTSRACPATPPCRRAC